MLLDRLFENLNLRVDPFATCGVSPGWRLTVPGLDWVVLHFVMEGNGTVRVPGGTAYPLPCYSLAVVPIQLQHDLECGQDVVNSAQIAGGTPTNTPVPHYSAGTSRDHQFLVACGRFQAIYGSGVDLFGQLREILTVDFSDSLTMRSTFAAVLEEQRTAGPASSAMMSALLSQCLVQLFRRLTERSGHTLAWLDALEDERLARVISVVLDQPAQAHSLEGLAEVAGMSRSVFARRFHEGFDRTPMDYVREVRLRSSAQLLGQPELSVDTIAARVGFSSRSHFSKAFSEQFGCSPTAFRTQQVSSGAKSSS